ncbi:amino acid/amide ABC transporter substrate-binding protein, HAAT family [Roseovarius mucosus DSM 17069]|uniref:Amino acid/amide ABC transporter substrate-binding protein, HAAT family n=1 Tax=Roseovarius mucosus DSM 17069 TaxID=1288298 RepID=A0A0A0HMM9_9RHOB|nr:ABC transporter substrate-binding protein [Roseovarius mucosus]KGM87894.1 amino acid/amide ABC transporter substrate-binding protein, HAAT family [Roseovarius mucosus DSM 17069]
MFRLALLVLAGLMTLAQPAQAQEVKAVVLRVDYPALLPVSRLDLRPEDLGFAGAQLATEDNQTTGQFMGQTYVTQEATATPETALAEFERLQGEGLRFFAVQARAEELLAMSEVAVPDTLIFNTLAPDTALRSAECRGNILHIAPSRQMQSDAVAQFLIWKKWPRWALIHGSHPEDVALAEAYRASAVKFGAKIVDEREFTDTGGARRTDTGHVQVQRQLPVLTQDLKEHDVIIAADETDVFATYLPFHTWRPSPIVGSAGLRPLAWHPALEAWGGTQFQNRFEELTGRYMRPEDYTAWLALRVLGEAVTRTKSADPAEIRAYALSDKFELAAFKGQKLTFRAWNGQLRQPILLADGRIMLSVSPQEGFLHQRSLLDTLGLDQPESACTAFDQ